MKIYSDISLESFGAWSGAVNTLDRIRNAGKCDVLEAILDEVYPDGLSETALNDILWFEPDWCYEMCGIRSESEIREELKEAKEELENLRSEFEDGVSNDMDEIKELEEKISELEEELVNI